MTLIRPYPLFLFFLLSFIGCTEKETGQSTDSSHFIQFESDLEETFEEDGKTYFKTSDPNQVLTDGHAASTEFARSGTQSIRLDSTHIYGLGYHLEGLKVNQFVNLSVWVHRSCTRATIEAKLSGENNKQLKYRTFYNSYDYDESDWALHALSFVVTPGMQNLDVHIFSGRDVAYFDDFSLSIRNHIPENEVSKELKLTIPDSSNELLHQYISTATQYETIPAFCKAYIPAIIKSENSQASIEMKLKGDWTDHLLSGKASYRIKIKGDLAYEGLKNFSVQHPKTRNYLNEWVIHKIADQEDVLTTTYDFINLTINGSRLGVYALEEHFDKQLIESRNRREGPILKMDETSYWTTIRQFDHPDSLNKLPYFQQSPISVFKKNRTRKSPQLSKQFDEGKRLLHLFKNGHLAVEELFDMDALAKFYVLAEISGGGHALRWHNRRFYYNPVTQKLEHILYDVLPLGKNDNYRCLMSARLSSKPNILETSFDNSILYNTTFKERYFFHLKRMTDPAYWDTFFKSSSEEISRYETAIQQEMPHYEFEQNAFYENAAFLRAQIPELEIRWNSKIENMPYEEWIRPQKYATRGDDLILKDVSINAYVNLDGELYTTALQNFHTNSVTVYGYQTKAEKNTFIPLKKPIELAGFRTEASAESFQSVNRPTKIYFTAENAPEIVLKKSVYRWSKPEGKTTRMELASAFNPKWNYFDIRQNEVIFSGKTMIDTLLYIPKQYTVRVLPGTEITFKNGGGLIVNNQFTAAGTSQAPILISAGDTLSYGLTVLQGKEALFEYVTFRQLSNLDYKNWELTGAITIYETNTSMRYCTIENSNAEDALNIIRSSFALYETTIDQTLSDGFDADFCQGTITACRFTNTGNDCLDFSGSEITVTDTEIAHSGDKGISGGEASELTLENVQITRAQMGVAAKDGSIIQGNNLSVSQVHVGCSAFRKKPEYDPAQVTLTAFELSDAKRRTLIEQESQITLNGEEIQSDGQIDVDALYTQFKK